MVSSLHQLRSPNNRISTVPIRLRTCHRVGSGPGRGGPMGVRTAAWRGSCAKREASSSRDFGVLPPAQDEARDLFQLVASSQVPCSLQRSMITPEDLPEVAAVHVSCLALGALPVLNLLGGIGFEPRDPRLGAIRSFGARACLRASMARLTSRSKFRRGPRDRCSLRHSLTPTPPTLAGRHQAVADGAGQLVALDATRTPRDGRPLRRRCRSAPSSAGSARSTRGRSG